jgi:hypothetical protein
MLTARGSGLSVGRPLARRTRCGKRSKRKRQYSIEPLETRALLSYTFVYGGINGPQTVNEAGGSDSFKVINNGSGLLEYSINNGPFSTDWDPIAPGGAHTLNASNAVSLTINLGADNSAIIDGDAATASSSASEVLARWTVNAFAGNTADSLTIDDLTSPFGAGTYNFTGAHSLLTPALIGPSGDIMFTLGKAACGGGVTIQGSNAANSFAVGDTYTSSGVGEPVTILGGSGDDFATIYRTTDLAPATVQLGAGSNTVQFAAFNLLTNIGAPVFVTDPTALEIDDNGDTTHATATLDALSGNKATPFEVTGLGNAPIEYGAGVTAVNIYGGTNGTGGVTYDINNTPSGTTTTIYGGPNANTINLSNGSEPGGLNNLAGPVVVKGAFGEGDIVTLDDSDADFNANYTVTISAVTRFGFGGLTVDSNAIGTLTLLAQNALAVNGNTTINIDSTANFVTTNVDGQGGADTINVNDTGFFGTLNLTTGNASGSAVNVIADNEPVDIVNNAAATVDVGSTGGAGSMAGIQGPISVSNPTSFTALTFHDENDSGGQTWTLDDNDGLETGSVAVAGRAVTSYSPTELSSLTINAGSGGNTFNVNNTSAFVVTDLNTGTGADTVNVFNTGNNTLDIHGQDGLDAVTLGARTVSPLGMQGLTGTINVDNATGSTNLIIDLSSDGLAHVLDLSSDGTTSTLHDELGKMPPDITYSTASLASLTIDTDPTRTQTLNINVSGGNPIPIASSPGLIFNADGDGTGGSTAGVHSLNIFGELPTGPFAGETHNANDPIIPPAEQLRQYGSIAFDDGTGLATALTSLWYTGLQPINDTAPAVKFTFDTGPGPQSIQVIDGPIVNGLSTTQIKSAATPPGFALVNFANKSHVVVQSHAGDDTVVVNNPTAAAGLLSLQINTADGSDQVDVTAAPPIASFGVALGNGDDVVNIRGIGLAKGPSFLFAGGTGIDTLNYDAGGQAPTITSGPLPGEVLITIPGAGTVDAIGYQQINITNPGPLTITAGPALTINGIAGYQVVDALVGTFTLPITAVFPAPPRGFPASDFTASIDWGDGTLLSGGMITQDASNPSLYDITGTYTFRGQATYTVANTVTFSGGTITTPVTGTPVSVTYGPAGPTAGNPATAIVAQDSLTVTALPIAGTEGEPIAADPIATFIDAGGPAPVVDYSASIAISNSIGFSLVFAAASITQNGNTAEFTVNAPAFTLPEEGTYQIMVSVTDSHGATPITFSGTSPAVIADAPLTAGPPVVLTASTGVALPDSTIVGTFTDANLTAPVGDFTATVPTIDWGDGSSSTGRVFATVGGGFEVEDGHAYAKPGIYATQIVVTDKGGSTVTLIGTIDVSDLRVIGATTAKITAVEGMATGTIVLATFTDPDTLATISDVTASVPVDGWGDGTPDVPVPLALQQIGVTLSMGPAPGQPIFAVFGSHKYAEETSTSPFLPLTLTINVTTLGGVTTTLTSPLGGGVTVLDAPLTARNGKPITGTMGISTGMVPIGTFVDANSNATSADFTTLVFWGDGTSETLTAMNYSTTKPTNGVIFAIRAAHRYTEAGQHTIIINVTDDGGQTATISSTATIASARNTILPSVPIKHGYVPPTPVVDPPVGSSTHTTIHKVKTPHKAKPAVTVNLTVGKSRVHDTALQAILAEIKPRRLYH